jgi:hypothetical protein
VRSVAHVLYQSLPFITAALRALGLAVDTTAEAALDPLPPVPGAVSAIVSSDPVLAEPAGRPLLLVPRGVPDVGLRQKLQVDILKLGLKVFVSAYSQSLKRGWSMARTWYGSAARRGGRGCTRPACFGR